MDILGDTRYISAPPVALPLLLLHYNRKYLHPWKNCVKIRLSNVVDDIVNNEKWASPTFLRIVGHRL